METDIRKAKLLHFFSSRKEQQKLTSMNQKENILQYYAISVSNFLAKAIGFQSAIKK